MIRLFRILGFVEGISWLVLLFVAMPLKYMGDDPRGVEIVGPIHGALFVAYCFSLLQVYLARNWSTKRGAFGFVAALVPFGIFYFDRCFLRWEAEEGRQEGP